MNQHNDTSLIADRYGSIETSNSGLKIAAWVFGILFAAGFVLFLVFQNLGSSSSSIDVQVVNMRVDSGNQFTVDLRADAPPNTEYQCAIEVQNSQKGIVGWKVVDFEASPQWSRSVTVAINTSESGASGLISGCWLP